MADLAHYLYHRRQLNVVKNNFYRSFVQFYISYNALFIFFLQPKECLCLILQVDSCLGEFSSIELKPRSSRRSKISRRQP